MGDPVAIEDHQAVARISPARRGAHVAEIREVAAVMPIDVRLANMDVSVAIFAEYKKRSDCLRQLDTEPRHAEGGGCRQHLRKQCLAGSTGPGKPGCFKHRDPPGAIHWRTGAAIPCRLTRSR
jgi:hypothetical protein